MSQNVYFIKNVQDIVSQHLNNIGHDHVIILCDDNTFRHCLPLIPSLPCPVSSISIPSGEKYKSVATLSNIWTQMSQIGASRHSLMICLGGGMVCDMGGMAAACFKRGIDCWYIPTTLLSMVDAALGGKTGINHNGLKNEIGLFRSPDKILVFTDFLLSLPHKEFLSGYAEMLKHALLSSEKSWAELLNYNLSERNNPRLAELIKDSQAVKYAIVESDPLECGPRKALNLGHTVGHALESILLEKHTPEPHGYCVAWGLVAALYLSVTEAGLPSNVLYPTARFVFENYGRPAIECKDYDQIYRLMTHDKKNRGTDICFTLLENIGKPKIDCVLEKNAIFAALDFIREG